MIVSMTGYGRQEAEQGQVRLVVEIRAVNHRHCEIITRLPKAWGAMEDRVKKVVAERVRRGRVEVSIACEQVKNTTSRLSIDWEVAEQYIQVARQMNEQFGLKKPLQIKDVFLLPGVVNHEAQAPIASEDVEEWLFGLVEQATTDLLQMKQTEGKKMYADVTHRLSQIRKWIDEIKRMAPEATEEYSKRLRQRIMDLIGGTTMDESRLLQEVALFAERADISEETTRLESHCDQFSELLEQREAIGRKLDFLLQEMNREANTIASKANHLPVQRLAVEVKTELEKMREQIQNIE